MFEQALSGAAGRTSKPWTVSLSVCLQTTAVAAILLYPLLRIETLPPVTLKPLPLRSRAVELVEVPANVPKDAVIVSNRNPLLAIPDFKRPVVVREAAIFNDSSVLPAVTAPTGPASVPACLSNCSATPVVSFAPPPPRPHPEAAKPDTPVRVGGDVRSPELVHYVKPAYPPLARQARIQGKVRIEAIISRDGIIRAVQVVSGHPLLVPAALDAVRHWRYRATMLNREPVEVALSLEVNFTLSP